jgi:hypothetical protein
MASRWPEDPSLLKRNKPLLGALVGALTGAATRYLVALGFIYYIHHWGGAWWGEESPGSEMDQMEQTFALWSAGIGLFVGAVGGVTCRPLLGTVVGAMLSATCCLGLFVLPATLALQLSGPNTLDRIETVEILGGLAAMTLAGALAGGVGAAAGRRRRGQKERTATADTDFHDGE